MSSFVSNPTITQQMPNQPGSSTTNNSVRYSPVPSTNPVTRYSPTATTSAPGATPTQNLGGPQFSPSPFTGQTQIGNPAGISPQAQAMMGGVAQPYNGNYFAGSSQAAGTPTPQAPAQISNATNTTSAAIYNSNTGQWGNLDSSGNFVPMGGASASAPPPGFTSWQQFASMSPTVQTPATQQQQINNLGLGSLQPTQGPNLPLSAFGLAGTTPEAATQTLASNILNGGGSGSQQGGGSNGLQQFLNLYRVLSTGQSPTGQPFTMDPTLAFSSIMALLSGAYGGGSSNLPLYNRSLYSQVP